MQLFLSCVQTLSSEWDRSVQYECCLAEECGRCSLSDLLVNDAQYAIMPLCHTKWAVWAGVRASVCVQMYVHVCVVVHVVGSLAPLSASALITTAIVAHWGGEGG